MTVSKTVRLSEDLVAFVETRPGNNFTEKLVGILDDLVSGKDKRLQEIRALDKRIEDRRKKLSGYWQILDRTYELEGIYRKLIEALVKEIENELKE